jgi:16S rRNA (guanine527-N7)-methyltransferase
VKYIFDGVQYRIPILYPTLSQDKLDKIEAYHRFLIEYNQKINLISPRTEIDADILHILDAILGTEIIFNEVIPKEIYDFGSGNGIPGILMAIFYPNTKVIAVEADARKSEFLKSAAHHIKIKNFSVINSRIQDLPKGSVHFAVSRGLASISKALLMARKVCAKNCYYYHFKSRSWTKEVAELPAQIVPHWEPCFAKDYVLPVLDIELSLVLTKKIL